MHVTCWITKAIDTHSEFVMLIAFPRQPWLHARHSVTLYVYCLSFIYSAIYADLTNCAMVQVVDIPPVTTEALFRFRTSSSKTFDVECTTRPFFNQVNLLSYVSIFSPVRRTRLHAHVPLTRRTNDRCLGIIQNAALFQILEKIVSKCTVILSIPQSM